MIDIVFPCWNRLAFAATALDCLYRNTDWTLVNRLVIYDDGSTDGTREFLDAAIRHSPCPTTIIRAEQTRSPVAIMGRHIADPDSADWFAKIDSDVCVPPGWLNAMHDVIDRRPHIDLLGMEAGMTAAPGRDGQPFDGRYGIQPCSHIGGVGLMRRDAFIRFPTLKPDGRFGLTAWQLEHRPPRAWITPDLPVVLLDRLPFEPWLSLSAAYVEADWQRPWPAWDKRWMSWVWDPWFVEQQEAVSVHEAV